VNKQNNNVIDYDSINTALHRLRIDYDYIKSNHDYNRDYICLETFSKRKQKPMCKLSCKYIFRQHM